MGVFDGANVNKLNGNLNRSGGDADRVIVLIAGITAGEKVIHKQAIQILDITAAETLGITASSDSLNGEQVHYHLSEIFRLCPGFASLWLIPTDKAVTVAELVVDAEIVSSIRGIKNRNVIGIAGIASAVLDAINVDVLALQGLVNTFRDEHILIDGIFLEGIAKEAGGDYFNNGADLADLRALTAENISVVVGQDPAQVALNEAYATSAAVGTVLGSVAVRAVHEDLGSVDIETKPRTRKGEENYSLADQITGRWLSAALSDGTPFEKLTPAQQTNLANKGYIFVGNFEDYDGYYLSGCPTATDKGSDYAYFNFNCIWNKAARIIRRTLIPKVRSKVPTDPNTGNIKSTWISDCEGLVNKKLEPMVSAGNCEGTDIYINPAQTVSEDKPMIVKGQVVTGQIVHEFDVDLGLTNSIE